MDEVLSVKSDALNISNDHARVAEVANVSMQRMIDPQKMNLHGFLALPAARSISG